MPTGIRADIERTVRASCDEKDWTRASEGVVRGYGPEIFGFLCATHKNEDDASDVFSEFCVALLRGLPGFRWNSSLRTWTYTLARNASHRFRRDAGRRGAKKHIGSSALDDVAAAVRTSTLTFLQTKSRTGIERLRDELDPDDRELLVLRVDRGFSWDEIVAMSDAEDASKEAARLRKRFQLVKEKLRELARRDGLVA